MTRYTKIAAAAAAALLAAPAFAAMTTDANLELDSDYLARISPGASSAQKARGQTVQQGGRVEFNVAGKAGDAASGFVAGRGTLLIKKDGTAATDDMWGQVGIDIVDVKLGRFEATDMFPVGKDTLVEDGANTAGGYRNILRGRRGNKDFHAALTVNPGAGFAFELGIVEHKRDLTLTPPLTVLTRDDAKGIRPVVSFAAGPVTVKLAVESGKFGNNIVLPAVPANPTAVPPTAAVPGATTGGAKFSGFAGTVGGAFEGVGFNVNLGSGKIKSTSLSPEIKSTSFGANATFGPAGVAVIMDTDKTTTPTGTKKAKDTVFYAAYSIPLFATGATLTPAISHQIGKDDNDKYKGATSLRVRLNYTF